MTFFTEYLHAILHHLSNPEKIAEFSIVLLLEILVLVILVERVLDFVHSRKERRRALRGIYDHMLVISATALVTDESGKTWLTMRSVGPATLIATVFTNPTDQEALRRAMRHTSPDEALLDLDPEAESRILPDLRSHVSGAFNTAPVWAHEMRTGRCSVPKLRPFIALTNEHGQGQTTKLRVVVISPEHLAHLPPESEWADMVEEPRHVARFHTLVQMRDKNERNRLTGKKPLPDVEIADTLAFFERLAEIAALVNNPSNGILLTRLEEFSASFHQPPVA